jgi:hypothetical protein
MDKKTTEIVNDTLWPLAQATIHAALSLYRHGDAES